MFPEQLLNQYDSRWAGHRLGSAPGELGPYGCRLVADNMIVWDAFGDMHYTPDKLDEVFFTAGQFTGDLLDPFALDHVWPDRFQTTYLGAFNHDLVLKFAPLAGHYVRLWLSGVYSPLWKIVVATHFVDVISADGWVADPAGGVRRSITAYGPAWSSVKGMWLIAKKVKPVVISAPPIVVAPPAPPPPPAPTYAVSTDGGILIASGLSLDDAVARAEAAAASKLGTLYAVRDAQGHTLQTAFHLSPQPDPEPQSQPTTAPPHVQTPDFWAQLQSLLILLLLPFVKARGRA